MSSASPQSSLPLQVQALLNRLQARLGSGLADAAASLLAAAEQTPGRLGREWELFWQEVELETERLAHDGAQADPDASANATGNADFAYPPSSSTDPQVLIDSLRAQVAALSQRLDA